MVNSFIELKLTARNNATKIVELQNKFMTFYYDLKAVQQESQVTQYVYLLQKTVQKIPKEYQSKYADVCMEKKNQPGETQWKILMDFLMTQVAMLEQHMPWELEVKAADGRNPSISFSVIV